MPEGTETVRRVSSEGFRAAMVRFAAGVVVVTTSVSLRHR